MALVYLGDERADVCAEHADQRLRQSFEDSYLAFFLARHGSHLAADESRADDVQRLRAIDQSPKLCRGRQLAEIDGTLEARQRACPRAGRDAKHVPGDLSSTLENRAPLLHSKVDDANAEHELDLQLPVLLGGT
ncbi:MAG: hypothetical protein AUG84_00870 [Chloroflexi bacterium 13_1_20CM_4_66_7]|nr:MAG: hypothetical protein AUG84_00870 [Chloroflexi bacterium 13_1_20CM_4_66_7]